MVFDSFRDFHLSCTNLILIAIKEISVVSQHTHLITLSMNVLMTHLRVRRHLNSVEGVHSFYLTSFMRLFDTLATSSDCAINKNAKRCCCGEYMQTNLFIALLVL